ncbi:MAG TPA: aldo/keto reductase [Polyangiaceae bacterium LLY-WYZ-15_(1-7)]|nr:aldo/keto reductase [Sandaracinus sp.]HJL05292.1 aldo/keto reductase [Polyangiaceae bacterium LLY-WYZ-15_(1-7)]HJL07910.1 aldo/keto reductase [Polyangiaceae bacterium LLY-WYZ-15_(1-7)]HJL27718.1 aldo/keto reductase [Polyangiaceae bacterium LLY-WYZ-15_(1-7)]HJL50071.1 aldo/keto reductase [Polyangiaceae bacterium LLY-WYZ-15_(1-7)]
MEYALLGRTGVRVSRLAFGTMSFGGDADAATSAKLYARCRDAGINLFDTADMYSRGESERILGGLVAAHRDQVVLATKAYFPMGEGPNDRGTSRFHLVRAVEASLKRLGTDRIDLFYLHRWDEEADLEETLRAVDDLVRQGKILYPAISNFSAWQTMKAVALCERRGWARPVAIQPMYNLVKRQAEVELLPMSASEGLGVFPYSPLAAGLLTGKYGRGKNPDAGRLVENATYMTRYGMGKDEALEVADGFVALADEVGVHPVSLAVAWVAAHPAVTAPLLGARKVEQLEPALAALEVPMDEALYAKVAALTPAPPLATDRAEEGSAHDLRGK